MKAYEGIFIFAPEVTPEVRKNQLKKLEDTIQKYKGSVREKTEWGKKPLPHVLRKFREGFMVLLDFEGDTTQMQELRKALELQDDILKFMITIKPENRPEKKEPARKPAKAPAGK